MSRKTLNTLAQIHQEQKAKEKRKKVVDQTTRINLTPEAHEFKAIMNESNLPIEQVVFLNGDTPHDSNRYFLEYPATWRTISSQKLSVGVRSTTIVNTNWNIDISFCTAIYNMNQEATMYYHDVEFNYHLVIENPEEYIKQGPRLWLDALNQALQTFIAKQNSTYTENEEQLDNDYRWTVDETSDAWVLKILRPSSMSHYGLYLEPSDFKISNELRGICSKIDFEEEHQLGEDPPITRLPRLTIPKNSFNLHKKLLLSASFVGQTQRNYLGFTDVIFSPPKIYPLSSNDQGYYIELFTEDGVDPVELPRHHRQLIVIEIQLIQESPIKYNF